MSTKFQTSPKVDVTVSNVANCTLHLSCSGHDKSHQHGADCGHPAVSHDDHYDYVVEGHLHHVHGTHCDDHGKFAG